ncbi:MAG: PTS sugar transporter subunit IIA [Mariprofundaceae bacterium]
MIGIILIAHANIADEMLAAAEHVLGKQSLVATLNVADSDHPDLLHEQLTGLIRQSDTGDGVFILADMFGGTPCNVALSCIEQAHIEILSGFNLPALIKALSLRQQTHDMQELAREIVISGQQYMCLASDYMATHNKSGCSPAKSDLPHA